LEVQKSKLRTLALIKNSPRQNIKFDNTEPSEDDSFVIKPKPFSSFCGGRVCEFVNTGQLSNHTNNSRNVIYENRTLGGIVDHPEASSNINISNMKNQENQHNDENQKKKEWIQQQSVVPFELKALVLILILIVASSLPAMFLN
jgi:hypothetical protein